MVSKHSIVHAHDSCKPILFLFSLDQTDQTGAMTQLSGKCLKESWLYRKTSQLKGSKVIFYYLDRFFRNLAKTNKKIVFFGSENHKIDIFSVTSLPIVGKLIRSNIVGRIAQNPFFEGFFEALFHP